MTTYQITNATLIAADRRAQGTSQFAAWVRNNFAGKFIVAVNPVDTNGAFNHEPLKSRGYEFTGAGADHVERGLLAGKKTWFRAFETIDAAESEIDALTETGI